MEIISRTFDGIEINFSTDSETELYINATETAKIFNKKPNDWLRLKDTQAYIDALIRSGNSRNEKLVIIKQSGNYREQGTWIHKKLIIAFARWLSPDFAVWCDQQIEEILSGNNSAIQGMDKIRERTELLNLSKDQFNVFEEIFYKIGITRPEELAITSNRAVSKETGVDFIELAEKKGVSTPEKYFTVTELCQKVMDSDKFSDETKKLISTKAGDKARPQNLNKLLSEKGYQTKVDGEWKATEKGKSFSDLVQNKAISSEKTVFHLLWKRDVLERVLPYE